jgi:hypothetical protein
MKIATSELTGAALRWAVAHADGATVKPNTHRFNEELVMKWPNGAHWGFFVDYDPSTDWAQAGPIIERAGIDLRFRHEGNWAAHRLIGKEYFLCEGPAPLIAAMRCFVASKLGEHVEVPDELLAPATPERPAARRPRI